MTRAVRHRGWWRLLAFAGIVAGVAAVACVDIQTGPQGAVSIRLASVPPAIIIGDELRDSTGAPTRLHAIAYGENGDSIADVAFRFTATPLTTDTSAAGKIVPVDIDSITGAVRAKATVTAKQVRVAVRLGDRLQVVDTISLVKKPTQLARATTNADSVMGFLCNDSGRVAQPQRAGVAERDTVPLGNAQPLSVLLTADSTDSARAPIRSFYIHYDIVSPTNIPTVTIGATGIKRPAIGFIADLLVDRTTNTDTTETNGIARTYLRVFANGLTLDKFPRDTITVVVRATARTSPTDVVKSPTDFTILLRRINRLSGSALTGPACR